MTDTRHHDLKQREHSAWASVADGWRAVEKQSLFATVYN